MTEQAETDADEKAQADAAAETEQQKKRRETAERLAAEVAANETQSRFVEMMRARFADIDPTSLEFFTGVSNVADFDIDKKSQNVTVHTKSGHDVTLHNVVMRDLEGKPSQTEYIGLTTAQKKKTPLTDDLADVIIEMTMMRGWTSINVHGSPQERDMLWLAAMKQGLEVKNFNPSAEYAAKWNAMKGDYDPNAKYDNNADAGEGFGVSGGGEAAAPASAFLPAPEAAAPADKAAEPEVKVAEAIKTSSSRFVATVDDGIVDAEFTEVDAPASGAPALPNPQKRLPPPAKP